MKSEATFQFGRFHINRPILKRLRFKIETLYKKQKRFVKNAPKNVPLTDDDILNEISIIRNGKGINGNSAN